MVEVPLQIFKPIQKFSQTHTKLIIQCLLGMVNFYRRFLPRLAHVVCPLTNFLATTKREFRVTEEMQRAVTTAKNIPANATLLAYPIRNAVLRITSDASDNAIQEVLHQHHLGILKPLAFFSRKLNDAECRYSTRATQRLITNWWLWHGMNRDIYPSESGSAMPARSPRSTSTLFP